MRRQDSSCVNLAHYKKSQFVFPVECRAWDNIETKIYNVPMWCEDSHRPADDKL